MTNRIKIRRLQQALGSIDGEVLYLAVHEHESFKVVVLKAECWARDEALFVGQLLDALVVFWRERKLLRHVKEPNKTDNPYYDHLFTPHYQVVVFLRE